MSEHQHNRQRSVRHNLTMLKKPCAKCGEQRPYVIEFHHIDPKDKSFEVGKAVSGNVNRNLILSEIEKCVCLCSNCHNEYHYFYGKQPKHPVECLTEYLGGDPYTI